MSDFIHKEYPKTVGETDFWKQIKRTVNGKDVSIEDIQMIVEKIMSNMNFNKNDHLLDFGCGNGALASYFFPEIGKYTGVDFSEYLLSIANKYFKPNNDVNYIENNVTDFIDEERYVDVYSKVLVYGVMSYFSREELYGTLEKIARDYVNVEKIYIGNIPNKDKAKDFFSNRNILDYDLNDPKTPIGMWWIPEDLLMICNEIGFEASVLFMPDNFYGAKYRFDLLLNRV